MGRRNKIKDVTPPSKTTGRKKALQKKWVPNERVAAGYKEAQAQGPEAAELYLKTHPKFAKKIGMSSKAPKAGMPSASAEGKPILKTSLQYADKAIRKEQEAINADTTDAYGNRAQVTYDKDGKPHYTTTLGKEQQAILDQKQGLTQAGDAAAAKNLAGYQQFAGGTTPEAERARIEEQVYGRLTRNTDRDFGLEKEQLEQTLYNRGIPLDPTNPAYKQNMDALNEKYSAIKENAASQATQLGGQEMSRNYEQQLTTHQQGMADTSALQGYGTGLVAPQTGTFQSGTYNTGTPAEVETALKQMQSNQKIAGITANASMANAKLAAASSEDDTEEIPQ